MRDRRRRAPTDSGAIHNVAVRLAAVSVLVAGCGRFNFFELPPRDDAALIPGEAEVAIDAQLATDAPVLMLDAGQCPTMYMAAAQSCYRLSLVRAPTWLDAELSCEADGVGAHLVTVDNAQEASLLVTMFAATNDYWSGMSDRITEGVYRNVTGELAPYVMWTSGEPTSSDCAQFDGVAFHVSDCNTSDEYACEFDGRPAATGAY
jgi:hypothetical protein